MDLKLELTVTCGQCHEVRPPDAASQEGETSFQAGGCLEKIRLERGEPVVLDILDILPGSVKEPTPPSKNTPRPDFTVGADLRRAGGKSTEKERSSDRDNGVYKNAVFDPKAGQEIHRDDWPRSGHFGHGSAELKKIWRTSLFHRLATRVDNPYSN
jgi:hypothetical protein